MSFLSRRAQPATGRVRYAMAAPRPASRRPGVAYRLVQFGVIPVAALLVVAWGLLGDEGVPEGAGDPVGRGVAGGDEPPAEAAAPPRTGLPVAGTGVTPLPTAAAARAATPGGDASERVAEPSPSPSPSAPTGTPTPVDLTGAGCAVPADLPAAVPGAWATTGTADLRGGAGLACPVLREVRSGTAVRPRGELVRADGVGWRLVEVEGEAGWVFSGLVGPAVAPTATATASPTAPPAPRAVQCAPPAPLPPPPDPSPLVATSPLNLRPGPGLDCGIVRVLEAGTEVRPRSGEVLADGRSWVLVEVAGETGWVATEFLRDDGP